MCYQYGGIKTATDVYADDDDDEKCSWNVMIGENMCWE